jgi:acyl dehydratase
VIVSQTNVTDPGGRERGPSRSVVPPERAPDIEVPLPILPQQALLYRLCGDHNPLHSDPEFAAAAGFPRPVLHGLCSDGIACKAIVDTFLDGDASRVHSYGARFASVMFPGETLRASIWTDSDKLMAIIIAPGRDDAAVLSGVELIPV